MSGRGVVVEAVESEGEVLYPRLFEIVVRILRRAAAEERQQRERSGGNG